MTAFLESQKKEFDEKKGVTECSICMFNFVGMEDVVQLSCSDAHIFHVDCLLGWLETLAREMKEKTCPLCRVVIKVKESNQV